MQLRGILEKLNKPYQKMQGFWKKAFPTLAPKMGEQTLVQKMFKGFKDFLEQRRLQQLKDEQLSRRRALLRKRQATVRQRLTRQKLRAAEIRRPMVPWKKTLAQEKAERTIFPKKTYGSKFISPFEATGWDWFK